MSSSVKDIKFVRATLDSCASARTCFCCGEFIEEEMFFVESDSTFIAICSFCHAHEPLDSVRAEIAEEIDSDFIHDMFDSFSPMTQNLEDLALLDYIEFTL